MINHAVVVDHVLTGALYMLARKMKLKLNGSEVGTTPMLVPSFSSKANIDVRKKILNKTLELVVDCFFHKIFMILLIY